MEKKFNLAIFASGAGSNALKLIEYFEGHPNIQISLIVSNKEHAGVLKIASDHGLPSIIINREIVESGELVLRLASFDINIIVLAGYLWKIPLNLIASFPEKIINIHPALLPAYGGKGMYGSFVYEAVITNQEFFSGITVHLVDEHYDHGKMLFQAVCEIEDGDNPSSLAEKIHKLEHAHFAQVVESYLEILDSIK